MPIPYLYLHSLSHTPKHETPPSRYTYSARLPIASRRFPSRASVQLRKLPSQPARRNRSPQHDAALVVSDPSSALSPGRRLLGTACRRRTMRNHTSRLPSPATPCSRYAHVESDGIQDVSSAYDPSPRKMTYTCGFEQDTLSLSSSWPAPIPSRRNIMNRLPLPNLVLGFLVVCTWIRTASAIGVNFENCLPSNYIYSNQESDQVQLQWIPVFVDAVFDTQNPSHNLRVTVWGNVTGRVGTDPLPPPGSANWSDPELVLNGKILNEPDPTAPVAQRKVTTLHNKVDVLTYEPYFLNLNFCDSILNGSCPLGPVFDDNIYS